ncbi:recombinase family protein [Clostridium botulinum]|nr:recombinase family protein [Clostridium botulinum]
MKIAIYSRKSIFTGKGESIENQIKLCKEYCDIHYKNENLEYIIYEDEGFSGKNIKRPQFQNLLNDVKSKQINILICYRLDRISRNVADFSSILELLEKYNVDFISINERFDTSTPTGRAMVYISSVFAQLERETIAERVKDNMIQLAKMGKWSGGQLPLGYTSEKVHYMNEEMKEKTFIKLVPVDNELDTIQFIYNNFLTKGSILNVTKELNSHGYKTKTGINFEITGVKRILRSALYVKSSEFVHEYLKSKKYNVFGEANGNGYLGYNKRTDKDNIIIAVSNHKGVISSTDWLSVQKKLDANIERSKETSNRNGTGCNDTLFSGLLKCGKCGSNMVIKYNGKNKDGISYIYYTCSNKEKKYLTNRCDIPNLRSDLVDPIIVNNIKIYNKDILIKEYKNKLSELLENSDKQIINDLKSQINDNEKQARNLVTELSKTESEDVKVLYRAQIDEIIKEINKLKSIISSSEETQLQLKDTIMNIKHLIQSFIDFNNYFDNTIDINIKRTLLRNIVEKVTYDADKKDFNVKFFRIDSMQLDSASEPLDCNLYPSKRRRNCRFT